MAFFVGREGSITISGTAKPLDKWELDIVAEEVETTNFTSSGHRENEMGIRYYDITASGPYNGIAIGASAADVIGTSVVFVLDTGGSGPTITVSGRVTSAKVSTDVRGVARIDYTAKSNGSATTPLY